MSGEDAAFGRRCRQFEVTETVSTDVQQMVGHIGLKLRVQGNAENVDLGIVGLWVNKLHSMNKISERDKLREKQSPGTGDRLSLRV